MILLGGADFVRVADGSACLIDAAAAIFGNEDEATGCAYDEPAQSCQGCLLWHTEQREGHGLSIDIAPWVSTGQDGDGADGQHARSIVLRGHAGVRLDCMLCEAVADVEESLLARGWL